MAVAHTLGRSGRTRGEEDRGEIVGLGRARQHRWPFADIRSSMSTPRARGAQRSVRAAASACCGPITQDGRALRTARRETGQAQAAIGDHGDAAGAPHSVDRCGEFDAGRREHRDAVAVAQAARCEIGGDAVDRSASSAHVIFEPLAMSANATSLSFRRSSRADHRDRRGPPDVGAAAFGHAVFGSDAGGRPT